jgi:hypothetical protein
MRSFSAKFPVRSSLSFRPVRQRGGVLVTAAVLASIMALLSASVVDLTMSNYKASHRLELLSQGDAVVESEFEHILYRFSALADADWADMGALLSASADAVIPNATSPFDSFYSYWTNDVKNLANRRTPFLAEHQNDWRVVRMITVGSSVKGYDPRTNQYSDLDYLDVKVVATYVGTNLTGGNLEVKAGRKMLRRSSSIFGNGLYVQGDLELNPSSSTTFDGDMLIIGNVYMGARNASTFNITINGMVRQPSGTYFNERPIFTVDDPNSANPADTIRILPSDINWRNYFNNNPGFTEYTIAANDRRAWLYNPNVPNPPSSSLGDTRTGVLSTDPLADLTRGIDDATWHYRLPQFSTSGNDYDAGKALQVTTVDRVDTIFDGWEPDRIKESDPALFPTVNDVIRSLITPPPGKGDEYATGLSTDSPLVADKRIYNKASHIVDVAANGTITINRVDANGTLSNVTTALTTAITSNPVAIFDEREQRQVLLTEIDVGLLKPLLETSGSGFNGVLYVNVRGNTTNTSSPIRAVRVKNAAATPNVSVPDERGVVGPAGFTLATNSGMYVQGNYNTTPISGTTINASALAADAITVLSPGWNDANALNTSPTNKSLPSRIATSGNPLAPLTSMTINAGILTGNAPTISGPLGSFSGGINNLVRYMEDWDGKSVTFNGSLARLFDSKHFSGGYKNSSLAPGDASDPDVFYQPERIFTYNTNFRESDPPGASPSRSVLRGIYYSWP